MDFKSLEYFQMLAHCLNFTNAANKLYVSQPAFSRKILNLEEELGCSLINRSMRPMTLTDEGEIIARWADRILADLDSMNEELKLTQRGSVSRLCIGYNGKTQQQKVMNLMQRVQEEFPGIQCSTQRTYPAGLEKMLYDGEVDGIFIHLPHVVNLPWAEWCTVTKGGLCALVPRNSRLFGKEEFSIRELAGERLVEFPREVSPYCYDYEMAACRDNGFAPSFGCCVTDIDEIGMMVTAGQGIALMSETSVEPLISSCVSAAKIKEYPENFDLVFAWNRDKVSPNLKYFCKKYFQQASL